MSNKNKLVYGVGLNDADYVVQPTVNGKQICCPFYQVWASMLMRCYNAKYRAKQPTYIDCYVCEEWLTFSNFKNWMQTQDWEGKQLDKDLSVEGNKMYSPETCVFVSSRTNLFVIDRGACRGEYAVGVNLNKITNKFQARCSNPFTKKLEHLGYFTCSELAHQAWKKRKHELACQLADLQDDPRVAKALRERYAPDNN